MKGIFGNSGVKAWRALRELLQRVTEPGHLSDIGRPTPARRPSSNG